jgi:hypothetical protein
MMVSKTKELNKRYGAMGGPWAQSLHHSLEAGSHSIGCFLSPREGHASLVSSASSRVASRDPYDSGAHAGGGTTMDDDDDILQDIKMGAAALAMRAVATLKGQAVARQREAAEAAAKAAKEAEEQRRKAMEELIAALREKAKAYTADRLSKLSLKELRELDAETLGMFSREQMAALSVEAIAALTPAQLAKLTNEQVWSSPLRPRFSLCPFLVSRTVAWVCCCGGLAGLELGPHQANRCDVLLG